MSRIKLDENFYLEGERYNWILVFEEERKREKKDGTKEMFTFRDNWYFPKIEQALSTYKNEAVKSSKTADDILNKLNSVENAIKNLKI